VVRLIFDQGRWRDYLTRLSDFPHIISGEVKTTIGLLSNQVRKMGPYRAGHLKCVEFEIPMYIIQSSIVEKVHLKKNSNVTVLTFFSQKDSFKNGGPNS